MDDPDEGMSYFNAKTRLLRVSFLLAFIISLLSFLLH